MALRGSLLGVLLELFSLSCLGVRFLWGKCIKISMQVFTSSVTLFWGFFLIEVKIVPHIWPELCAVVSVHVDVRDNSVE